MTEKKPHKLTGFVITDADKPLIAQLQESYRVILLESGKYEAIAARLGIEEGTVKSRMNRARVALIALRDAHGE